MVGAAGLLIGVLLGMALATVPRAEAGTGNAVILGLTNESDDLTLVKGAGGATLKIANVSGSGIPLILASKDGQPPLQVNSSGRVRRLNADKVDGWNAYALGTRVVTAGPVAAGPICVGANCSAQLLTATIEVPRDGVLIVGAGIDLARYTDGDDVISCRVRIGETFPIGGRMGVHLNSSTNNSNQEENCTMTSWHPVEPGNHTVVFEIAGVRDTSTVVGSGGALWVMWAPIDGTDGLPFNNG